MQYLSRLVRWFQKFRGKSLADELAEVFDSVAELKKLGINDEDPEDAYSYLRIVDICDAFRGALFERGIMVIPKDVEHIHEIVMKGGHALERSTVRTEFSLVRGSESLFLGGAYGSAVDSSDKSLAIAQTAAFKAQLKRMSMIYGVGEDPETNRDTLADPREAVRLAEYQRRAWDAGVRDSGLSHEVISAQLSALMGFAIDSKSIPDLPNTDFDNCMKWLLRNRDLTAEWIKAADALKEKRKPLSQTGD